jgi:hypothetical protein
MTNPQLFIHLLVEGTVGAVVLIVIAFLLSRFTKDIVGRSLLVIFLFAAAGAYFGFAIAAGAGLLWTLVELAQVVIFGTMALLGLRGSLYWLAAGCVASTLGRRASLHRAGALICSYNLCDRMYQF